MWLAPVEIAAAVAAIAVPLPVPALVPLVAIASVSVWIRRGSWAERMRGPASHAAIGATAGLVGLAVAVALGTPIVEMVTDHAVQWSVYPVVRGNAAAFVTVAVVVGASAVASELVLRGWIVDRLVHRGAPLAVAAGALVEAMLVTGDAGARAGAGLFGAGLGAMYVAGGRNVVPTICARLAFSLGALALEALRAVG